MVHSPRRQESHPVPFSAPRTLLIWANNYEPLLWMRGNLFYLSVLELKCNSPGIWSKTVLCVWPLHLRPDLLSMAKPGHGGKKMVTSMATHLACQTCVCLGLKKEQRGTEKWTVLFQVKEQNLAHPASLAHLDHRLNRCREHCLLDTETFDPWPFVHNKLSVHVCFSRHILPSENRRHAGQDFHFCARLCTIKHGVVWNVPWLLTQWQTLGSPVRSPYGDGITAEVLGNKRSDIKYTCMYCQLLNNIWMFFVIQKVANPAPTSLNTSENTSRDGKVRDSFCDQKKSLARCYCTTWKIESVCSNYKQERS